MSSFRMRRASGSAGSAAAAAAASPAGAGADGAGVGVALTAAGAVDGITPSSKSVTHSYPTSRSRSAIALARFAQPLSPTPARV